MLAPVPDGVSGWSWVWLWMTINMPQLASTMQGLSFAVVVKGMCMAGNVIVQVSPFPQVKRWESRHSTGEADAAPYISIAFGGWQWCFYGMFAWYVTKRNGFLILVHSNCLGALLGSYYTLAFFKNCKNSSSLASFQRYTSAVMSLVLLQVCTICVLPAERALFLTGLISSFCSFVGAMSMLVTVPQVLLLKDSRSIPGPLVCANLMSASVWCICGYMLQDPLVYFPNIVSVISSSVCVYLKTKYPSGEDEHEKDEEAVADISSADKKLLQKLRPPNEFTPLKAAARSARNFSAVKAGGGTPAAENSSTKRGVDPSSPVTASFGGDGTGGTGDGTGGTF